MPNDLFEVTTYHSFKLKLDLKSWTTIVNYPNVYSHALEENQIQLKTNWKEILIIRNTHDSTAHAWMKYMYVHRTYANTLVFIVDDW